MKPMIEKTKTRASHISVRTLALVLCFVMLISAIGAGTVLTAIAQEFEPSGDAVLAAEALNGADVTVPEADDADESPDAEPDAKDSSDAGDKNLVDDIIARLREKEDLAGTGADADLTKTGDTTYYVCYNLNNSSAPNNLTSSNQMKSIDGNYWGEIPSNGTQFYFGISDSSTFVGHSQLGSGRNATKDSNGVINQVGNQPYTYSGTDYYYCYGHTTSAATVYVRWDGSDGVYLTTSKPAGYDGGGGGGGGGGSDSGQTTGTAVNDADLIAVLKRTKLYIYYGDYWNDNAKRLYRVVDTETIADGGPLSTKLGGNSDIRVYYACISLNTDYRITHDTSYPTWAASFSVTSVDGDGGAGSVHYNTNGNGHGSTDGSASISWDENTDSIKAGTSTCDISATATGSSAYASATTVKYFYTSDNTNFYEFNPSSTASLNPGTYTIYAAAYDGNIYIAAATQATLTVYPRLTTPVITLDTATDDNTSSQTASTTAKSTVTVTNVNSYDEGTVFTLYKGDTSIASNTTGVFSIARNTNTAGVYKVIASPGASDTTHSDSADSNTPTLSITKVAAPETDPIITLDKNETIKDGKVVLTVTNAASFDPDIYDLYFYKVNDGSATKEAPFEGVIGQALTTNPLINVAQAAAVTAGTNDHTHYYVVAEAKDDTVYTDSGCSNVENVWIQIPRYWFTGNLGDGSTWGTGSQGGKNKAADQYFGDNTFYHKYTAGDLSGNKYFRIVSNSSNYGTNSTTDDVAVGAYSSSNNMYTTLSGGTKAMTMNFDNTKSYYMFVHQRTDGATPQFYYSTNLAEVTVTPKYLEMNHTTGEYKSAATDTTGAYLYTPTEFTLVSSGGTLTLTATVTNSDYEFVGWFDSASDFNATPLSTELTYTTAAISEDKTYYPLVREKVTRHNVTVKTNNARLGSGSVSTTTPIEGQTVTVTVSPNTGDFSAITAKDASNNAVSLTEVTAGTTYTFTMPDSNVTVNLTFDEADGSSHFYYNGYDTSGQPLSGYFGQQMSIAKIGGVEYSYFHVEGRTGLDQLFTVSYGNPDYTDSTWVYFQVNKDWDKSGGWGANEGQAVMFLSSDDVMIQDWTSMTWDNDDVNGYKQWKCKIPDGARYAYFKGETNGKWTKRVDLNNGTNGFTLQSGTDSSDSNRHYVNGWHNNDGLDSVPDMYENFNGTSKYTSSFSTGGFNNHNATRGGSHSYSKPNNFGTNSGDYYVLVLYKGSSYTINGVGPTEITLDPEIIWMPKLPGTEDIDSAEVNVYGKDGSVVIDWNNKGSSGATTTSGTAYGFGVIADTKLYDSDGSTPIGTAHTDDGNDYESAKVVVTSEDSADIVIETTIASDYRLKYYLKGWCINGVTYACGNNVKGVNAENAVSDGVYTMTYTVPAGTENNAKIEITPIYYLTSTYKSTNEITTVTFYLEGYNTVIDKWGHTPYIYPFYGNLNNVDNSFGVYPGQPMVYTNGQYSIEVPVNKNVPIAKEPGSTAVKGITISNGYADHVHRNLVYKWTDHDNDADHKQTYDYDDFYKIYEECLKNGENPNAIFFRIQDEETVYNRSQYGGGKSGQFASGTSNITISDIDSTGNGWELLVNRYGHAVNIFGDQSAVSDPGSGVTAADDTSNAIYVVSTGYNANIAGDYGTMWKIYNGSGQLISNGGGRYGIPPSVLLLRGSSSGYSTTITYPSADRSVEGVGSYKDSITDYETIYKALHNSSYTDKRVYITYEKDAQDTRKVTSGTGAYRLDGRWYYTHAADNVQSTMSIQYWDDSTGAWVDDNGASGTPTYSGCDANFTDVTPNDKTSGTHVIQNNQNFTFAATVTSGWQFDSWQIKYSDTSYDQISTSATSSMPATANYHIVARFVKTSAGSLTINHSLNSNSTGEGTVDMAVNVYTDSSMTTLVTGFTEKTGTRVYLDSTYINNSTAANYYIKVQLKATPQYDGKVTAFGYDSFNTSKSITATTSPATLPGSENTLTTSTFSFPVSDLYNVSTQKTDTLNYTSLIAETPHYYNFTYQFTSRGSATANNKSYTSKGVMSLTEYKKHVTDQAAHTLNSTILVTMAPFESNFLKTNTLSRGNISYNSETHTYSATSTFTQNDKLPDYHVVFKLPYNYYTTVDPSVTPAVKKYTVQPTEGVKVYNASNVAFDLLATYNTFVTVDATSSAVGTQENVDKVSDGADINHTGNNFITAPDELMDDDTPMYFKYWKVSKLKADGTAGDLVTYIYYPDFNYRVYSDYYVEAVYSDVAADSWRLNYSEDNNETVDCSVLYLGDSRNQWNDGTVASTDSSVTAADKIYSDFIFHYTYKGQELSGSENVEVGMILERATYMDGETQKWLTGSTSVNDMNYYRAEYGGTTAKSTEAARKSAISSGLSSGTLPNGTVKVTWDNSELNNKNFTEQNYSVYSQYGQTVANDTITFAKDNTIDNYVYRAYAYIKGEDGSYTLSDPVYFCMRYTSNLKYTE